MRDRRRFWFGTIVSVIWIGGMVTLAVTQKRPDELNAWGDFFAGFFAPLAFLWLVLGYLQQGEELRQSTEALRLQAAELKNSVEQQSQLVAVSREQMQQELRALEEERERRRDTARPKFVPVSGMSTFTGGVTSHEITVTNVGNAATHVRLTFNPPIGTHREYSWAVFSASQTVKMIVSLDSEPDAVATLTYMDADNMPGSVHFSLHKNERAVEIGPVERTM